MAQSSVREALDQVNMTFKSNFFRDPTKGKDGQRITILKLQLNNYKSLDPKTKNQRCLNPIFILQCFNRAITKMKNTIAEFTCLGFFFAMRSFEFSEANDERKTRMIIINGIRFFRENNATILQSSHDIFSTYSTSVDFLQQKISINLTSCLNKIQLTKIELCHSSFLSRMAHS